MASSGLKPPRGAQCWQQVSAGTSRELVKPAQGAMVLGKAASAKKSHLNGDDHTQRPVPDLLSGDSLPALCSWDAVVCHMQSNLPHLSAFCLCVDL